MGFFEKLKQGLTKTRDDFNNKMASVFSIGRKIDEEFYEELEETLIQADVGVQTAIELTERLREREKKEHIKDVETLRLALQDEIVKIVKGSEEGENKNRFLLKGGRLNIILVVGVNGAGKTTTIGKMANYYNSIGHKVLLAAADTFRAAAIEQLCTWGERAGVDVIHQSQGSDPGAVVFDACRAAASRGSNILIIDTAGRLQNKTNLMEELRKINRIIDREAPGANVEVLLVLDAGTGQNAISQAKLFGEVVPLTGIILTKLDGTAKGGVVIGITNELNLPVKMIGVGEGIDDLREFVAADFAAALFDKDNDEASNYEVVGVENAEAESEVD
jgi:fused signal recognition particle receptor